MQNRSVEIGSKRMTPVCDCFATAQLRRVAEISALPAATQVGGICIGRSGSLSNIANAIGDVRSRPRGIALWRHFPKEEAEMKLSIALAALLTAGFVAASTEEASAVVYCQYVAYPVGCVVRPGIVLRPRPIARAVVTPGVGAPGVGVRRGTPMNRGGPVNRVGRR